MPNLTTRLAAGASSRVPGLRRLPILKLLVLAELAVLARDHLGRLSPAERRRLYALERKGHGRARNLAPDEREELVLLLAKLEPRRFAGVAVDRLSPFPLPKRLVHGPAKRR